MRITISAVTEAVTEKQFQGWDSKKQRQWLKDHPTSKFGKKSSAPNTNKPTDKSKTSTPLNPKALRSVPKYVQKEVQELADKMDTPEGSARLMKYLKESLQSASKSSRPALEELMKNVKHHRREHQHGTKEESPHAGMTKHPVYQDTVQALRDAGIDPKSPAGIKAIRKEIDEYKAATGR